MSTKPDLLKRQMPAGKVRILVLALDSTGGSSKTSWSDRIFDNSLTRSDQAQSVQSFPTCTLICFDPTTNCVEELLAMPVLWLGGWRCLCFGLEIELQRWRGNIKAFESDVSDT